MVLLGRQGGDATDRAPPCPAAPRGDSPFGAAPAWPEAPFAPWDAPPSRPDIEQGPIVKAAVASLALFRQQDRDRRMPARAGRGPAPRRDRRAMPRGRLPSARRRQPWRRRREGRRSPRGGRRSGSDVLACVVPSGPIHGRAFISRIPPLIFRYDRKGSTSAGDGHGRSRARAGWTQARLSKEIRSRLPAARRRCSRSRPTPRSGPSCRDSAAPWRPGRRR